jgi:uncharacterized membrane protein YccC
MTDSSKPQQGGAKWTWQFMVAVGLLLAFAALDVVMLAMANTGNEIVWQRRVYIFGAVEAVVFTAVGWLFGREVSRSAAESAKQEASDAKKDATEARDKAEKKTAEAASAEQKEAAERARSQTVASVIEHSELDGATPTAGGSKDASAGNGGSARPTRAVVDLKALVRDLYS